MIKISVKIAHTLNICANENSTITGSISAINVLKWLLEIYVGFWWILDQKWGAKYYRKKSWSIWNLT